MNSTTMPADAVAAPRRRHLLAATAGMAGLGLAACASPPVPLGPPASPVPVPPDTKAGSTLFEDLEHRTFLYFWETTPVATGLTPDRWPQQASTDISVAAVGFALTAYPIGVARGWITREQGVERVRTTLRRFRDAPQGPEPTGQAGYKGFFYHHLDARTHARVGKSELSTIDTAILLMGALYCREWFNGPSPAEGEIRRLAEELYARVDWEWARHGGRGIPYQWHPEHGHDPVNWSGYDEGMIIYLLAFGSPTHPIPASCWNEWTSTYATKFGGWGGTYGQPHLQCPLQFIHQYTQVWVDLRGVQDDDMRRHGIDYFENSRRATYAQQAYAIANPEGWKDYGELMWGFTASDGPAEARRPFGGRERQFRAYTGRGIGLRDDGTLSPAAVAASLPFAPEIVVPTLKAMHAKYGELIYGRYGLVDAFNPSFDHADVPLAFGKHVPGKGWFDTDHLAIAQGPILAMFANYRGDGVWAAMRQADWLRRGMTRAGFRGGWLEY